MKLEDFRHLISPEDFQKCKHRKKSTWYPLMADVFVSLHQVRLHWESKERPEMTLEKLEMVATAVVAPEYTVRWLGWWNARPLVRAIVCFSKARVTDNQLLKCLNKATFYARLKEAATAEFDSLLKN